MAGHHRGYGTGNRNDLWIADLNTASPRTPHLEIIQHQTDIETYTSISRDGHLYLVTTAAAPRRQLYRTRCDQPSIEHWTTVVPHDEDSNLTDFALLHDGDTVREILVVRGRHGFAELAVHGPNGEHRRSVGLPGSGRVRHLTVDQGGRRAHLVYAGVNQHPGVYTYQLNDDIVRPAGFVPSHDVPPELHRRHDTYRSADGTVVPIVVLSSSPITSDDPGPTILHAYGSFGEARQFGFSATVLAWLELGGKYVVACVRGGGDLGRSWHHDGIRTAKTNSIDDLIAAGDWLVERGYTTREQLCLSGGSAGGLLMLAAITRRADIARAAIASAPLADMVRFEQLGLGALWRAEFGTAADPDDLAVLLSYSPYHNVRRGRQYPAVLLTGFHGDTRVDAAHARKMTAALQAATSSTRPILLRYQMQLGHSHHSRSQAIALAAEAHAFAAAVTGLQPPDDDPGRPQPQEGGEP